MRTLSLALLGLCGVGITSAAQTGPAAPLVPFLDFRWGTPADTVVAAATRSGLTFLEIDVDGDYAFRGQVAGEDALLFATFSDSGLTRLLISVNPHPGIASAFERLRDSVTSRRGRPLLTTDDDGPWRPASGLFVSSAWRGILMGLRRDGRILVVLSCPSASPALPAARRGTAT